LPSRRAWGQAFLGDVALAITLPLALKGDTVDNSNAPPTGPAPSAPSSNAPAPAQSGGLTNAQVNLGDLGSRSSACRASSQSARRRKRAALRKEPAKQAASPAK
jgi:hypothetical protein